MSWGESPKCAQERRELDIAAGVLVHTLFNAGNARLLGMRRNGRILKGGVLRRTECSGVDVSHGDRGMGQGKPKEATPRHRVEQCRKICDLRRGGRIEALVTDRLSHYVRSNLLIVRVR